ncbi:MAG TPA: hypothetical protein VJB65_04250 [Patescibacteria group bacterium]|nr:hypothetical protein [Patescibacteria group bacterium]
MMLTTHAAIGIMVTQWTANPLVGFTVALSSHYLTDVIPHGDEWLYWRHVHNTRDALALISAAIDLFFLIVITLIILNYTPQYQVSLITAAIIGGVLPDILMTLHTKNQHQFKKRYIGTLQKIQGCYHWFLKKQYTFHMEFHNLIHTPIRYRTSLIYQSIFLGVFLYYYI